MILRGKKIVLRPITMSDAPRFVKWLSDPAVNKFTLRRKINLKEERKWSRTHLKTPPARDAGGFFLAREARVKAYPLGVLRARSDKAPKKIRRIPRGFGSFPAPLRYDRAMSEEILSSAERMYDSVGVPMGTPSSSSLAGSGKELETRAAGFLRWVLGGLLVIKIRLHLPLIQKEASISGVSTSTRKMIGIKAPKPVF